MFKVYDHNNHPTWSEAYRRLHRVNISTNGAYTYSVDIVKHHIPVIEKVLRNNKKYKNILVDTVSGNISDNIPNDIDLVIIYLHENLERESVRIEAFLEKYKKDVIYITARNDLYKWIISKGIKAVHLPMSIDTELIKGFIKKEEDKYKGKRVVWFGNKYMDKDKSQDNIKKAFIKNGWSFEELTKNRLNGSRQLSREECLDFLGRYKYGVGIGRCYLEMNTLGLKCIIASTDINGIITNEEEYKIQKDNNFVGDSKLWTFSNDADECVRNIDRVLVKSIDVREILPILEKELTKIVG